MNTVHGAGESKAGLLWLVEDNGDPKGLLKGIYAPINALTPLPKATAYHFVPEKYSRQSQRT